MQILKANQRYLKAMLITSAFFASSYSLAQSTQPILAPINEQVKTIHQRTLVIDPHVDIPFDFGIGKHDPNIDGDMRFDFPKAQRGGIGAVALAMYVSTGPQSTDGYKNAKDKLNLKLALLNSSTSKNNATIETALTPEEVIRIHSSGKIAAIRSFLNAYSLGEDIGEIDRLYGEGVRIFGFTHAGNNAFADSSRPSGTPAEKWNGLSPLGRSAVEKLNCLGILIDVSQLSKAATLQTIRASRAPVIATHSGIASYINHPRNLSDEELEALRLGGGVVAINAYKPYLKSIPVSQLPVVKKLRKDYGLPENYSFETEGAHLLSSEASSKFTHAIEDLIPEASVSDLVDSIEVAVKKLGIDHVAISSDFNHGGGVIGWKDTGESINVTAELVKRGFTEVEIAKIWGINILNVWRRAQKLAGSQTY